MITGDYDVLYKVAQFNVCAEHKTQLEVAWYGEKKCYILRCGEDHYPDAVTRNPSLTESYKAGEPLPELVQDNIEKGAKKRAPAEPQGHTVPGYPFLSTVDLGTGVILPQTLVQFLIDYANQYGLDAARGHVCFYHGKPYVTLDGYLYNARKFGEQYSLLSRPMTTKEVEQYKIEPTDHGWLAEVVILASGAKFVGTGIVTYDEMTAKSDRNPDRLRAPVVASHPWQLAQKRAEWQALRRAFPLGIKKAPGPKHDAG